MAEKADEVVADLARVLSAEQLLTDPDSVGRYAHDEAEWAPYGKPAAVVRATGTEDVVAVVRACADRGVPVVPRVRAPACPAERTRSTAAFSSPSRR